MKPFYRFASKARFFVYLILIAAIQRVDAAGCCGGNFAVPSVITNSERSLLTSTLGYEHPHTEVLSDGIWRRRADDEVTQSLKINAAYAVSERWQLGASVAGYKRDQHAATEGAVGAGGADGAASADSASGFGDSSIQAAYEYLSDLNYSRWRPKAIAFTQVTLPTGQTAGTNTDASGLNVGGRGFYSAGLGTVLLKDFGRWDVLALGEVHRSFPARGVRPGWGGSLGAGGGYNWRNWRLGCMILSSYEDALRSDVPSLVAATASQLTSASLMIGYRITDEWAVSISYTDQTLLGSPLNTGLSRAGTVAIQRRWLR